MHGGPLTASYGFCNIIYRAANCIRWRIDTPVPKKFDNPISSYHVNNPPDPFAVKSVKASPKQYIASAPATGADGPPGALITTVAVSEQLIEEEDITLYVPGHKAVAVAVFCPIDTYDSIIPTVGISRDRSRAAHGSCSIAQSATCIS